MSAAERLLYLMGTDTPGAADRACLVAECIHLHAHVCAAYIDMVRLHDRVWFAVDRLNSRSKPYL